MAQTLRKGLRSSNQAKRAGSNESAAKNQDIARRFVWEIATINVHLQEIRYFWAKTLGISGPQWMILMALADLDRGEGVPVKVVSSRRPVVRHNAIEIAREERLHAPQDDARVVQMSLTDKTYKHIASLASQQEALNDFIFAEFSNRELTEFTGKLTSLKNRLEKASLKVAMDI